MKGKYYTLYVGAIVTRICMRVYLSSDFSGIINNLNYLHAFL